MTRADLLARDLEQIAEAVFGIRPLSRGNPHVFAEDKDALARRLRKAATELRNAFGGQPQQFRPGPAVKTRTGRAVAVEIRRRAA